ncbi:MAG TPA: hypothetical protein VF111_05250 [Thermoanaerobaculia bacterium]
MRWQILIPVASIVSSFLALSVIWWATERRREREAYYRYELSRHMLERYADDQERFLTWLREQEIRDGLRRREVIRLVLWVLLCGGLAALAGLGFTPRDESLFGWIPIGIAAGLAIDLLSTKRPQQ